MAMVDQYEVGEIFAFIAEQPEDAERPVVWVNGRMVCPSDDAVRFRDMTNVIMRRCQQLNARITRVNRKISRRLAADEVEKMEGKDDEKA